MIDICDNSKKVKCDETDYFAIAGMANNGPGFDINDMEQVINDGYYSADGKIDWEGYVNLRESSWDGDISKLNKWDPRNWSKLIDNLRADSDSYDTKFILRQFIEQVEALKADEYYVPENVDLDRLKKLSNFDGTE